MIDLNHKDFQISQYATAQTRSRKSFAGYGVSITHLPTGVEASCGLYPDMLSNRNRAWEMMKEALKAGNQQPQPKGENTMGLKTYELPTPREEELMEAKKECEQALDLPAAPNRALAPWESRFSLSQALTITNTMLTGVSSQMRDFLSMPGSINSSLTSRREASQFFRDLADKLDPEGPLSNRGWTKLSDVAEEFVDLCRKHEVDTREALTILSTQLESRSNAKP